MALLTAIAFGQSGAPGNASALAALRKRAEAGDARAQVELARNYASRDPSEALKWYRRAAEQGDSDARFDLAGMYLHGEGVEKNYSEAARWYRCPAPNVQAQASCRAIRYMDLPGAAMELLGQLKCEVRPGTSYDYGSAVDLNGDGNPEYQFCCHESPHGPCGAVVIGKVGSTWKELSPKSGVMGYDDPCGLFIVVDSRHSGYNDVCLPNECSRESSPDFSRCVPTIWNLVNGRYRSIAYTPATPPKSHP